MGLSLSGYSTFDDLVQAVNNNDAESVQEAILSIDPKVKLQELISKPVDGDQYGRTLLHIAAWSGNGVLSVLLNANPELESQDVFGWTPLWAALYNNKIAGAYLLKEKGALVPQEPSELSFLLVHSVKYNHYDVVSFLFEHGAKVLSDAPEEEVPPLLHWAVDHSNPELVRILLEKGKADPNTSDSNGWYPLHLAVSHDEANICKLLMEHDANVNVKDTNGNTPLAWARKLEFNDVCAVLETNGATADPEWHGDDGEIYIVKSNDPFVEIFEDDDDDDHDEDYYGPFDEPVYDEEGQEPEEGGENDRPDEVADNQCVVNVELDDLSENENIA
ncbi:hypothetical protein ACOME3_009664 [Neoechinorhynchus agilis]